MDGDDMQKIKKHGVSCLVGAACGGVIVVLSRCLIQGLGSLAGSLGRRGGMKEETVSYMVEILSQLKGAKLESPWLLMLVLGGMFGILGGILWAKWGKVRKWIRIVALIILGILLFLLFMLLAVWFTVVNDVRVGALLGILLLMLPDLM